MSGQRHRLRLGFGGMTCGDTMPFLVLHFIGLALAQGAVTHGQRRQSTAQNIMREGQPQESKIIFYHTQG